MWDVRKDSTVVDYIDGSLAGGNGYEWEGKIQRSITGRRMGKREGDWAIMDALSRERSKPAVWNWLNENGCIHISDMKRSDGSDMPITTGNLPADYVSDLHQAGHTKTWQPNGQIL